MKMNPNAAESYTFQSEQASVDIGAEALHLVLSKSRASSPCFTKEWVSNHYKWIVWKLASYERRYPGKLLGKFLTVSNVLEELKYRYEREVVHGHRSAIRKILDGDVVPSSMMVLCISSVCEYGDPKPGPQSVALEGHINGGDAKIELTDGWYSVKALLDEPLSQQLASRKLFLGQKLRCHWAERLGFCECASFHTSRTKSKYDNLIWPSPIEEIPFWKKEFPSLDISSNGHVNIPKESDLMHIAHITAEMASIAKVGGLGDVEEEAREEEELAKKKESVGVEEDVSSKEMTLSTARLAQEQARERAVDKQMLRSTLA